MGIRKKKKEEDPVEEIVEAETPKEVKSFEDFYREKQQSMDFNIPCHPDWYMLGASASQYPKSDVKLESPELAYKKYLEEQEK